MNSQKILLIYIYNFQTKPSRQQFPRHLTSKSQNLFGNIYTRPAYQNGCEHYILYENRKNHIWSICFMTVCVLLLGQ